MLSIHITVLIFNILSAMSYWIFLHCNELAGKVSRLMKLQKEYEEQITSFFSHAGFLSSIASDYIYIPFL